MSPNTRSRSRPRLVAQRTEAATAAARVTDTGTPAAVKYHPMKPGDPGPPRVPDPR